VRRHHHSQQLVVEGRVHNEKPVNLLSKCIGTTRKMKRREGAVALHRLPDFFAPVVTMLLHLRSRFVMASATLPSAARFQSGTIQIEHDTSMANTKTCFSTLQMTAILKGVLMSWTKTSAEIASGNSSKRQMKEVANHQMVPTKALRAGSDHQEQQVARTKGETQQTSGCYLVQ
jgi:hypothetical protein